MEVIHYFILFFLAISLYFAYSRVDYVRYHTKYIVYYICLMVFALISLPYSLLRPCRIENIWLPCWLICHMRWWFGLDFVELRGKEYLDSKGPFILVCNHQSSLDLYTFSHVWPTRCISVMKREIMYGTGIFGLACWLTGSMAIDRLNPESAKSTVKVIGDRLRESDDLIVLIFPEGTRNHGKGLLPFKKGAFNIAVNAQVPVVSMLISTYEPFMGRHYFNDGKFIISCLPPVDTKGLSYSDVPELTERVRNQMVAEFAKINKDVEALMAADKKKKLS